MIKEKIISMLDQLPDEELENVFWAIQHIERAYLYGWNLFGKGVKITNQFEQSEKLIACWDYTFASHLSEETKETIFYNEFKWHIFSNKLRECLVDQAAREAFNVLEKDELYVMYQHSPYVTLLSSAKEIVAEDFDSEQDIYIFDKTFTWTYVRTHEVEFGPYFCKIK